MRSKESVIEYLNSIGFFGNVYSKDDIQSCVDRYYPYVISNRHTIDQIFDDIIQEDEFVDEEYEYSGTAYICVSDYYEEQNRHLWDDVSTMLDFVVCLDLPEYPYLGNKATEEDYDLDIIQKIIDKVKSMCNLGEIPQEEDMPEIIREVINGKPVDEEIKELERQQEQINIRLKRLNELKN